MSKKINSKIFWIFLIFTSFIFGVLLGAKLNSQKNAPKIKSLAFDSSIFDNYFTESEIKTTYKTNKEPVNCPTEYLGIVGFGQSNIANRIIRDEPIHPIENVYMWDWTNGKCYLFSEPLVGTDGVGGNLLTDVVMNLKLENIRKPILVAPMAKGGSSVFFWYKGKQKYRLDKFLQISKKSNLNFDYWLWLQGETDARPDLYLPFQNIAFNSEIGEINYFYSTALDEIFNKVKTQYPNAVFGVSLTSKCNNNGNYYVRMGQKQVIEDRDDTFFTFDTDTLGSEYRSDGCHFNESGSKVIASSFSNFIVKHFSR